MRWFSFDPETGTMARVADLSSIQEASRVVFVAVGRWLLSGLDLPDEAATDGVSEHEAASGYTYESQSL